MAGTETKRIIELTEASTVQSGDYFPIDSASRGTKKVPTSALATSAALTAETNARTGADEQMSERMDGIEEQTALIQNPTKTLSGALVSFTDGADMPMVACTAEIVPKQSGTGTPSPSNVREISGWESVSVYVSPTEDEADGRTTTTSLGRTVYGGTLDVVSGELTVDRAMVTYNGSEDWGMETGSQYTGSSFYVAKPSGTGNKYDVFQSNITNKFTLAMSTAQDGVCITAGYFNCILGNILGINNVADFKTWLSSHNMQIVYPLANPQAYTLTPTEIQTLLGENNVWADSGDVEITYRRDISIVLENLENALNGSNSLNTMMMSAPTENTAEEPTEDEAEDDMR